MEYNIQLEAFEGPMDLLLHLIKVNEIDIYNIPIHEVTSQYLAYLESMQSYNMEVTSAFMVMAATLIEIKSKMLLPDKDLENFSEFFDMDDPRMDLVEKLLEYKKYKEASNFFEEREARFNSIFYREQEDFSLYAKDMTTDELNAGLEEELLMEAVRKLLSTLDSRDTHRGNFFKKLKRDNYTVEMKLDLITTRLIEETQFSFRSLFGSIITKEEVVVTFLALLELLKLKRIHLVQEGIFKDIYIEQRLPQAAEETMNIEVIS